MNEKCFGLAKRNESSILTEKKCAGYEQCPFKKYYADHESKTLMEAIHKEREREKAEQSANRCPDKNEISRP